VRSKCLARQGKTSQALGLARECGPMVEATDSLDLRWHALMSKAEVLRLAGQAEQAQSAVHDAIRAAERKGNLVAARLSREALSPV
jgi:hypothetical protein